MTTEERIARLGRTLCLTPGSDGFRAESVPAGSWWCQCWWVCGGIEGDQPMPGSGDVADLDEALTKAEAILGLPAEQEGEA